MTTIALDRRFFEWQEGRDPGRQALALRGFSDGSFGWPELLAKRRVVILAEAGSGKTEELMEQARLQTAAGKFALYATVQDVGRDGLVRAIRAADRLRLEAWRRTDEPGWFFIDSIDEAKLDHIRLERALRAIADAIIGVEGRAHVILSGRHTDWEFKRDLRRLNDELPLPEPPPLPTPPLLTLVRRMRGTEKAPDPEAIEESMVVVLLPLSQPQVKVYAAARGAKNLPALIEAIEEAGFWEFARRPMDLEWIVRYWEANHQLGTFSEMVEASLRERLKEPDPERGRRDSLDADRARLGLEDVGAALVLCRRGTLAVPDNDTPQTSEVGAISIDEALPTWSPVDRAQLLTRPVFDPATFGRARLHNDNEGAVRSYLSARWLSRLSQAELPRERLHALIFSTTYGIDLIKPSMLQTAAWLSLWDDGVANEVIRRFPALLLSFGDPARLSRPVRQRLLVEILDRMRNDGRQPLLDARNLMRFVAPDIAPTIRTLWESSADHQDSRQLLLRLVALGKLSECADIAEQASFGRFSDLYSALLAGRALMAAGTEGQRALYAEYILQNCDQLPSTIVWEATDELFPKVIGVEDFLDITSRVSLGDAEGGGFKLDWNGSELAARLKTSTELVAVLEGALGQIDTLLKTDPESAEAIISEFAPLLATAAGNLLAMSQPTAAPDCAVDAVLRVCEWRNDLGYRERPPSTSEAITELHRTPERRRAAFWRAAWRFGPESQRVGLPLEHLHQLRHFGWMAGLEPIDVEWLLADAPLRVVASERKLAINTSLRFWFESGQKDLELKHRIEQVANRDADMTSAYVATTTPYVKSVSEIAHEESMAELVKQGVQRRSEDEQAWIDFIERMRADPTQLRDPVTDQTNGVDPRIFNLWHLLEQANRRQSRHTPESLRPIEEIAGSEVAQAFLAGLSKTWRQWKPTLRSDRAVSDRNNVHGADLAGLAGVGLEANSQSNWASGLTQEEARRAAEYATLEINGLPEWLEGLSIRWPDVVASVLGRELASELAVADPGVHYQTHEYLSRSGDALVRTIYPVLLAELGARPDLNQLALRPLLPTIRRAMTDSDGPRILTLALERFRSHTDPNIAAQYLGVAYAIDARIATDTLMAVLESLDPTSKTKLVERALPQIFGSRWSRWEPAVSVIDFETLERLVQLAYQEVRIELDRDRTREVFSPDERDNAEEARSAAFSFLVESPGREAFDAIQRLAKDPTFPIPPQRMTELAERRASADSDGIPWSPNQVHEFELASEHLPTTTHELQLVAINRLDELQHDLLHGDFQQGTTLRLLPDEPAVQNWIADRLRQVQRRSYSVEREVHVAGEKEPDIRFRAKASDASVAMEIKATASGWTFEQLEDALENQLCGQYLRAREGREGIFLIVHQNPRPKGWNVANEGFIDFPEVVRRLKASAERIRQRSASGPQPVVVAIDVSSCTPAKTTKGSVAPAAADTTAPLKESP